MVKALPSWRRSRPFEDEDANEPLYCSTQSSFFLFHREKNTWSSLQVWVLLSSHKQGKILIIKSIVITISDTVRSGHIVVLPIWRGDKQTRKCNIICWVHTLLYVISEPSTWTDGKVTKKSQIWGLFTRRHQKNGRERVCRPSRYAWGKWDIWINDVLSVHRYDETPRTLSFQGGKMDFCLNNSEVPICLLGPAVLAYPGSGFMVSRHSKGNCLCSPPVGTKV